MHTPDIQHALEKIKANADALKQLDPASGAARHCLFQMSYNLGRLSELTGKGRTVYDATKPHVTQCDWDRVAEAAFIVVL